MVSQPEVAGSIPRGDKKDFFKKIEVKKKKGNSGEKQKRLLEKSKFSQIKQSERNSWWRK